MDEKKNEIILFENQGVKLEVNLKDETVWLNRQQLSELFKRDVKTIGKVVSAIDDNIVRYHYSRELAEYMYLLHLYVDKTYTLTKPTMKANYLVVSTIPQYYTKVRPVTNKELAKGFEEFKTLLKYVAYQIGYNGYSL